MEKKDIEWAEKMMVLKDWDEVRMKVLESLERNHMDIKLIVDPEECKGIKAENVGSRLSMVIDKAGETKKGLSRVTGISEASIRAYCEGIRIPKGDYLLRMCDALGVNVDWLLFGK